MVDDASSSSDEYPSADLGVLTAALERAHDIRKFEIELYWKRATYFWAIIAVAFLAFFASKSVLVFPDNYIVSCLGLAFSFAWYLVNRGGGYWQRNWEAQVDLLEDRITGPLHKTTLHRTDTAFFDLSGPYKFSPSRINSMLAMVLYLVWVFLTSRTIFDASTRTDVPRWTIIVAIALPIAGTFFMLFFAGFRKRESDVLVNVKTRKISTIQKRSVNHVNDVKL